MILHDAQVPDDQLEWCLDEAALAHMTKDQRPEYERRLAGRPVLPELRRIAALVAAAIG